MEAHTAALGGSEICRRVSPTVFIGPLILGELTKARWTTWVSGTHRQRAGRCFRSSLHPRAAGLRVHQVAGPAIAVMLTASGHDLTLWGRDRQRLQRPAGPRQSAGGMLPRNEAALDERRQIGHEPRLVHDGNATER